MAATTALPAVGWALEKTVSKTGMTAMSLIYFQLLGGRGLTCHVAAIQIPIAQDPRCRIGFHFCIKASELLSCFFRTLASAAGINFFDGGPARAC